MKLCLALAMLLASGSALAQERHTPAFHTGVGVAIAGAVQAGGGVALIAGSLSAVNPNPRSPGFDPAIWGGLFGFTQVGLGALAMTTGTVIALTNRKKRSVAIVPTTRGFQISGRF